MRILFLLSCVCQRVGKQVYSELWIEICKYGTMQSTIHTGGMCSISILFVVVYKHSICQKKIIIITIVVFVILSLLCACCGTFLLLGSNSSESDLSSTTDTDEDITTPTTAETQITPTTLANDDHQELSEDDVERHNLKRLSESGGIDLDKEILRILEERKLDEKFDIFRDSKTPTPTQKTTFNPTTEPTLTPTQVANNSRYSKIQAFVNPSAPEVRKIASDCEEHAYTLTSALIASGMKTEHVRVALGKVDFGGPIGGHTWL